LYENEIKKLKAELREQDEELASAKQDKADLLAHFQMSNKVKKSKLSGDIAQG